MTSNTQAEELNINKDYKKNQFLMNMSILLVIILGLTPFIINELGHMGLYKESFYKHINTLMVISGIPALYAFLSLKEQAVLKLSVFFFLTFSLGGLNIVFTESFIYENEVHSRIEKVNNVNIERNFLNTIYRIETDNNIIKISRDLFKSGDDIKISIRESKDGKDKILVTCKNDNCYKINILK